MNSVPTGPAECVTFVLCSSLVLYNFVTVTGIFNV